MFCRRSAHYQRPSPGANVIVMPRKRGDPDDPGKLSDGRARATACPLRSATAHCSSCACAALLVMLPFVYGRDVDQIVEATVARSTTALIAGPVRCGRPHRPTIRRLRHAVEGAASRAARRYRRSRRSPLHRRIMSLVVFRSKAAGEIFMFAETSRRILEIIGREDSPRGVITAEQVPDALSGLSLRSSRKRRTRRTLRPLQNRTTAAARRPGCRAQPITLGQRAFPLIEMLRAAQNAQGRRHLGCVTAARARLYRPIGRAAPSAP